MKSSNTLTQYQALRSKLQQELSDLDARREEIRTALNLNGSSVPVVRNGASHGKDMSLKDAIAQVTRHKPMSKEEILEAVRGIGYQFTTKAPIKSLNSLLYSPTGKASFTRHGGGHSAKFAPKG